MTRYRLIPRYQAIPSEDAGRLTQALPREAGPTLVKAALTESSVCSGCEVLPLFPPRIGACVALDEKRVVVPTAGTEELG